MKAVLYARVSSREQEKEGFSIPAQVKLLEEYAKRNGFELVDHFVEAETAKKAGRTQYNKMLGYLQGVKEPHCILVEKTDRLYRNFKDYVRLEELDVDVHLVKEGTILGKNSKSQDKFVHGIKVLMSKNYIDNLSEEVKKGQREKAEQGHFPVYAPYGYRNNRETKRIDVNGLQAPFVKRAFGLYSSKEHSLDSLRERLYEEGYLYNPSQKRIPRASLEKLLKNQIYMGDFIWDGRYYKGKHDPLIPVALFEKVQGILHDKTKGQRTVREFQFTGLMTCAKCGRAVTAEIKKGTYIYYHCANMKCEQRGKNVREEQIEAQIMEFLAGFKLDTEHLDWIVCALKDSLTTQKAFHSESVATQQAQLLKLQVKMEKIYEDKLENLITHEFWYRKHQDYQQEQQRLLRVLEEHKKGAASYLECGIEVIELAQRALESYKKRSNTERRRLLRFISSNYLLDGQEVRPVLNKAFEHIYNFCEFEKVRSGGDSNSRLAQHQHRLSRSAP